MTQNLGRNYTLIKKKYRILEVNLIRALHYG